MNNKKDYIKSVIFFTVFIVLIFLLKSVDVSKIGPEGTSVGLSSINNAFHKIFDYNEVFYDISKILGVLSFVVVGCFGLLGLYQLIQRKSVKKVDNNLITLGVLYVVTIGFYLLFEKIIINYRPVLMDDEIFPEASFPSTHTLIAVVVMLSACMNIGFYIKNKSVTNFMRIIFLATGALTIITRMFSGVHWFTDILGGLLLGMGLVMLYSVVMGEPRRKRNK